MADLSRNEMIIQRHSDGSSWDALAAEFGLSTTRIRKIVMGARPPGKPARAPSRDREQSPALDGEGASQALPGPQKEPTPWERGIAEAFHRDAEYMAETRPERLARKAAWRSGQMA
jgi:hypothetical protein